MKTAVVACRTLEDELSVAREKTGRAYETFWIESGLHNTPHRLLERVQAALDGCAGFSRVLLAFGFCGNAMAGLRTGDFELVLPRADDCISLLLSSPARRASILHTYFLTRGWLRGERTLWDEYQYAVAKYGEETGRALFAELLAGYRYLGVIDTGCYPLSEIEAQTARIAGGLGLERTVLSGSPDYLCELLAGPWEESRFLVFPPGAVISAGALTLP